MGPIEDAPRDAPDREQRLKSLYRAQRCPDCGYEWPNVLLRECPHCRSSTCVFIPQGAPIASEVRALAKEIAGWREGKQTNAEIEHYDQRLEEMNKRAGDKLTIGSLLAFDFQDGTAIYLVEKIDKTHVYARHVSIWAEYRNDQIARPTSGDLFFVALDVAEENHKMWQRYL